MKAKSYVYVATAYSTHDAELMEKRAAMAVRVLALLSAKEVIAYSPIAMTHHAAGVFGLRTDAAWWREHNMAMLSRAAGLVVVDALGMERSVGVATEVEAANALGIPVYSFTPATPYGKVWLETGKGYHGWTGGALVDVVAAECGVVEEDLVWWCSRLNACRGE